MVKKLLSVALVLAFVSQGIARADEADARGDIITAPTRASLLAHLDGMTAGDKVAIATAEGVVVGEFVDKDDDDVVIDRPLIQGGAERIAIPLGEIQGVKYQTATPSSSRVDTVEKAVIVAGVVALAVWLLRAVMQPRP